MSHRMNTSLIMILCLACAFMSGCGNGEKNVASTPEPQIENISNEQFIYSGKINENTYFIKGWKDYKPGSEISKEVFRAKDNIIYDLKTISDASGDRNTFESINPHDTQVNTISIPAEAGFENGEVVSFDLWGDGFVFLTESRNLVFSDEAGNCIKILETEKEDGSGNIQIFTDSSNRVYEISGSSVVILNEDGNKIDEYLCEADDNILNPISTEEGKLIFPIRLVKEGKISFVSGDGFANVYGEMPAENVFNLLSMIGDRIYYQDSKYLYSWDVVNGDIKQVVSIGELDATLMDKLIPIEGEDSDIIIHCIKESGHCDVLLSATPVDAENAALIEVFDSSDSSALSYIQNSIATFGHRNPQYSYKTVLVSGESYDREKEILKLTDKDAPALMLVNQSDLEIMSEKGLLADLRKIMPKDLLDSIIPSVLDLGTVDGTYYGLAPVVYSWSIFTNGNSLGKDGYTIGDIEELCGAGEVDEIFTYLDSGMYPEQLIYYLAIIDLEGNGFYDVKNGKSRFEENDFMKVLEIAKNYSAEFKAWSGEDKVKDGECLGLCYPVFSSFVYSNVCHDVGDGYAAGFPTNEGKLNIMMSNLYLAVNKQYESDEGVRRLLEYIYSVQSQRKIETEGMSARMDMCDYCVEYDSKRNKYVWSIGNGAKYDLPNTTDIETFKKEWSDYLLSTRAVHNDPYIEEIINEEVEDYFDGTKDALSVTRIIDNRVQLYLDENN